jgi:uncharacterized protein
MTARCIERPPRLAWPERLGVLAVVAALAASGPAAAWVAPWLGGVVALALLLGTIRRSAALVHLAGVALLAGVLVRMPFLGRLWPLPLLVFLAVYAILLAAVPWLRRSPGAAGWLRRGRLDRMAWGMLGAFAALAAASLIVWRFTTDRDLGSFRAFVPAVAGWLLPPGLVLLACLNAAFEELIWRGAAQHALEGALGSPAAACGLQAAAFGLWHFEGFPGGWVGVGLAAVFALMMGVLRLQGRGMLAPWLAHVAADVTIFSLVIGMVLGAG